MSQGIFQGDSGDDDYVDVPQFIPTRRMYYSPNDHPGVNDLMESFSLRFPGVKLHGKKNPDQVQVEYEAHLWETWASLEFDLSEEQVSSGQLVPSLLNQTAPAVVNYQLRISPMQMVSDASRSLRFSFSCF
jgi:hypothetical protein